MEEKLVNNQEVNNEVLREAMTNMFFRARCPSSITELQDRIREQAELLKVSSGDLEREFMSLLEERIGEWVD